MLTSVFLAMLIGPIFLAVGFGLIANSAVYKQLAAEFVASRALIYLSGLLLMTAGIAMVLAHNVWTTDWRVLVTLLGWLAAIGGAVRIVMPQGTQAVGRRVLEHPRGLTFGALVWLAIGAILCFFGYFR
jgi:hypothetical protein